MAETGSEYRLSVRRFVSWIAGFLPDGGIGDEGRPPDADGRRDTDQSHRRAVLTTKMQMTSGGQATTSYEPVDRSALPD
jgi:hypothetical protein